MHDPLQRKINVLKCFEMAQPEPRPESNRKSVRAPEDDCAGDALAI